MLALPYEIWKDVCWFEWLYKVSNMWNVISRKGRLLHKNKLNSWYFATTLFNWKIVKRITIHRLVASTFLWDIENKVIMHLNDIKQDNRVDNIKVWTHKENTNDAIKKGLFKPFWRKSFSLSEEVTNMLIGNSKSKAVAKKYWVHRNTILFRKNKLGISVSKSVDIELVSKAINDTWNKTQRAKKYGVSDVTIGRREKKFYQLKK